MADELKAWKPQRPALAWLAEQIRKGLGGAEELVPGSRVGYELLGVPSLAKTLERLGYGERLTAGRGQTLRALPETVDVATMLPGAGPVLRGASRGLARGALGASDAALRAITGNPEATAMRVIDEASRMSPLTAVIKPKGGNWLADSVERATEPLKRYEAPAVLPMDDAEMAAYRAQGYTQFDPETGELFKPDPINNWIDKKLAKYIRNEMATPEDPVRALAERGVLHAEPRGGAVRAHANRTVLGMPTEPTATSPLARAWEDAADAAVLGGPYRDHIKFGVQDAEAYLRELGGDYAVRNPDALAYALQPADPDLGFGHLADELRNMLNPESGLPRELLLTPEQLAKVSVPQAVERVARVNEWRAAQKAEADAARAMNPATHTFKEYPEQGYRWVELRAPKEEALSDDALRRAMRERDMTPGEIEQALADPATRAAIAEEARAEGDAGALADALRYEGETMGHCVGGYCPDVESGRSRIFSLRDKKGEPHVTVEVQPKGMKNWLADDYHGVMQDFYEVASKNLISSYDDALEQAISRAGGNLDWHDQVRFTEDWLTKNAPDFAHKYFDPEMDIVQIKGKGNRAPKDEYLPFVQDFVKSQKWGRVGDLENTGMRLTSSVFNDKELEMLKKAGVDDIPSALTGEDIQRFHNMIVPEGQRLKYDARGNIVGSESQVFARGGGVRRRFASGGAVVYNPAEINALADALEAELNG